MSGTDSSDRPSFGALLRRFRTAAGLSQEQLAERSGLSANAVSALERGTRQSPYRDTVSSLAQALGLAPKEEIALEATVSRGRNADVRPLAGRHAASLPVPPNPLVGREREIVEVGALLRDGDARLITLTGVGGVGKTRLALYLAAELADEYADGVVFVALAPLRDAGLVPTAIAQALGARDQGDRTPLENVRAHLRDASLLLVLDNMEHLPDAAPLVADLLASAPGVTVLATSRAALHLQGERLYPVEPLVTPNLDNPQSLETLAQSPALELLLQRARAVMPAFALTEVNALAVAAVCNQLEGLPLAIELAAARLTVLSPRVLSQRLERRLPMLTGGPRDLPERQRTMRATVAWSYDLLDEAERRLFRRLSVFSGGCRLDGAEAVYTDRFDARDEVIDIIGALIAKSLLHRSSDHENEPRFTMLETLREYGSEILEQSGELPITAERHAAYCLALAEETAPALIGAEQAHRLARLEEERDNVRTALRWALEPGGSVEDRLRTGLRTAAALWRFWYRSGRLQEGRRRLEEMIGAAGDEGRDVARALTGLAGLMWAQGDYEPAAARARRGLGIQREVGDLSGAADALQLLGVIAMEQADYAEAESRLEECLVIRRRMDDSWGSANALHNLGAVAQQRGEYARAELLYAECLALKRAVGDMAGIAVTLNNLGDVVAQQGHYERGGALIEEGLAIQRELGVTEGINAALHSLGALALRRDDRRQALALYEESLTLAREMGARGHESYALVNLGDLTRGEGSYRDALSLYQEALTLADGIGQQSAVAYALEGIAAVAAAIGEAPRATRLLGAASALRMRINTPLAPGERPAYDRVHAAVTAALGQSAVAELFAAGLVLPLDQAIGDALELDASTEGTGKPYG